MMPDVACVFTGCLTVNSSDSVGTVYPGSTGICGMTETGDLRVADGEVHCNVEGNSSRIEDMLLGILE